MKLKIKIAAVIALIAAVYGCEWFSAADTALEEAVQGTWLISVPSALISVPGVKRVFNGDNYEIYYYNTDNSSYYLVESGTFKFSGGVMIETAEKLYSSGALVDAGVGYLVKYEHPSFYVNGNILAEISYTGTSDDLIGVWTKDLEGPYYAMGSDGLYRYSEYRDYVLEFDSNSGHADYTGSIYRESGELYEKNSYYKNYYEVTYSGTEWSYTDYTDTFHVKSKIIAEENQNRLLFSYYEKQ